MFVGVGTTRTGGGAVVTRAAPAGTMGVVTMDAGATAGAAKTGVGMGAGTWSALDETQTPRYESRQIRMRGAHSEVKMNLLFHRPGKTAVAKAELGRVVIVYCDALVIALVVVCIRRDILVLGLNDQKDHR